MVDLPVFFGTSLTVTVIFVVLLTAYCLNYNFDLIEKLDHLINHAKLLKDPLAPVRELDFSDKDGYYNSTVISDTKSFLNPFCSGYLRLQFNWIQSLKDWLDNPCFCKEKESLLKMYRYVLSRIENTKTASSNEASLRHIFKELANCIDRNKHGSERDFSDYGLEIYGHKFVRSYNNFKLKTVEKTHASTMYCFENIETHELYTYEGWHETYEAICDWEKGCSENNLCEN